MHWLQPVQLNNSLHSMLNARGHDVDKEAQTTHVGLFNVSWLGTFGTQDNKILKRIYYICICDYSWTQKDMTWSELLVKDVCNHTSVIYSWALRT